MNDCSDRFPGAELSEQLLARIGKVMDCPAVLAHRLSGSIVNVVHAVRCGERELVAKFGASEGIRREAAILRMLRQTQVPAPHAVLLPADPTFPNDLLLLDVLPGQAAEPDSEVLMDAGRSLRQLHEMQLPGFGLVGPEHQQLAGTCGTWAGFLDAVVAGARQAIPVNVMPMAVHDEAAAQLRQPHIRAHLAGIGQGVLLHGDLMPKHVWNDQGRLAGLIDWGDAMVGDPLFDLARLSMAGHGAFRRFLKGYGGSTPPDATVLAFYRMAWSLAALTVECGAGGDWVDGYLSTVRRELDILRQHTQASPPFPLPKGVVATMLGRFGAVARESGAPRESRSSADIHAVRTAAGLPAYLKVTGVGSGPQALAIARRELSFYRDLAPAVPVRTPALVDYADTDDGIAILLEAAGEPVPIASWTPAMWAGLGRDLAALHSMPPPADPRWTRPDGLRKAIADPDLPAIEAFWGPALPRLDEILTRRAELARRMEALPPVFIHGDCHTDNITRSRGLLIYLDWQVAGSTDRDGNDEVRPVREAGTASPALRGLGRDLDPPATAGAAAAEIVAVCRLLLDLRRVAAYRARAEARRRRSQGRAAKMSIRLVKLW